MAQNATRRLIDIKLDKTFVDKCSGKDTNRSALKQLIEYASEGDAVHCQTDIKLTDWSRLY